MVRDLNVSRQIGYSIVVSLVLKTKKSSTHHFPFLAIELLVTETYS